MDATSIWANPIIQYGFAGMCALQFAFICWLVSRLLAAFERNTVAFQRLMGMLSTRPCLYNDREFQSAFNRDSNKE